MPQLHKQLSSPETGEQQDLDVYHVDYSPPIEDIPVVPWGDPLPPTALKNNTDSSHCDELDAEKKQKQSQLVGGQVGGHVGVDDLQRCSSGTDKGSLSRSTTSSMTKNNVSIIGDAGKEARIIMVTANDQTMCTENVDNHNVDDNHHKVKESKGKEIERLCRSAVGGEVSLASRDPYSNCGRHDSTLQFSPIIASTNEMARKTTRSATTNRNSESQPSIAATGDVNKKKTAILTGSLTTSRLDTKAKELKDPATGAMIKDYLVRHAKLSFPLDPNVSTNAAAFNQRTRR